ncbi:hypothetical protein, partial [Arthrobacter sp. OV608]|uniref:hypothetical protein n=1 Tax=Arthrobacter sp. OV608 TaxID=1882768 RepID=UPI0011140017
MSDFVGVSHAIHGEATDKRRLCMNSENEGFVPEEERDSLREKYRQERDKRLRAEGTGQYVKLDT